MQSDALGRGVYYAILDSGDCFIVEDKTKRGLAVRQRSLDEKLGVEAEKGVIHDMDGIGHAVAIRWFFPKADHTIRDATIHAENLEARYTKLRELTCPD